MLIEQRYWKRGWTPQKDKVFNSGYKLIVSFLLELCVILLMVYVDLCVEFCFSFFSEQLVFLHKSSRSEIMKNKC